MMQRALWLKRLMIGAIVLGAMACTEDKSKQVTDESQADAGQVAPQLKESRFSVEAISRGAAVFQTHCAECHGPDAQGHPDWGNPNAQYVVAPPLDGNGPSPKRSRAELIDVIVNGVTRDAKQVMPGWKGRLKDSEVIDTITWFQALWPATIYEQWEKAQADGGKQRGS